MVDEQFAIDIVMEEKKKSYDQGYSEGYWKGMNEGMEMLHKHILEQFNIRRTK